MELSGLRSYELRYQAHSTIPNQTVFLMDVLASDSFFMGTYGMLGAMALLAATKLNRLS
jgi:hypothetical protein